MKTCILLNGFIQLALGNPIVGLTSFGVYVAWIFVDAIWGTDDDEDDLDDECK
jgi:hypothetical protein